MGMVVEFEIQIQLCTNPQAEFQALWVIASVIG